VTPVLTQIGMGKIHPTAIVNSHAELDTNVEVGPYSVIGPKVKIGKGTKIKSHVVIEGNTTLGVENTIFHFATIGSIPQDLKYQGEDSQLIIGSRNTVREFASLNPYEAPPLVRLRGPPQEAPTARSQTEDQSVLCRRFRCA